MSLWNKLRPMISSGSSSGMAKVGFALATAFALGTASTVAFPSPSATTGRKEEARRWNGPVYAPLTASRVYCEAAAHQKNGESLASPSSVLSEELNASNEYELMNPPSRMDLNSHAVGQLLQPGKIERYEIYKKKNAAPSMDAKDLHVVTALVDFGDSLDGHPKVVHGGILALVLDDVFGFSFGALGVRYAVTANLNLNFRAPTPAGTSVKIQVELERRENRKLYFKGEVTSLDGSVIYAESTCLYIIPRSVWEKMNNGES
ncbi:Thioesterase superfamily [Seminavis robusta]|uniref:Thioesterase superfamily n=1 Tax=Seminavis robusta TaxID=568900 RepID=A0A9N8DX94_9STRA|nr:Thioesterase superfamily [Seminavis robusta]|eukprot:Sro445_g144510.1 Thioesterase superfamily (261) ;mRNA; r:31872-32654